MQTDTITLTCTNNSNGFNCTTPSFFSGGEMFISFCLVILIILAMISLISKAIFSVSVHKKFIGRYKDGVEGAEVYKL